MSCDASFFIYVLLTLTLMGRRKTAIPHATSSALNQLQKSLQNQLNRRNQHRRNQQNNKQSNKQSNNWVRALPNAPTKPVTPNSSYQRLITTNRAKRIYNRLMKTSHAQHPKVYWVAHLTDRWNVHNPYKNYTINNINTMSNTDFFKLWRTGLQLYNEEQQRRLKRVR